MYVVISFPSQFLPAAKPTGHRKVRVAVVGGDYFVVMTLKVADQTKGQGQLFLSVHPPDLSPIILFGVGSVAPFDLFDFFIFLYSHSICLKFAV